MPEPLFAHPTLPPLLITTPTGPAGGDLTGTYPDPEIAPGAVTTETIAPGAVTDANIAGVAWSKIINPPTGLPPTGPASGVLTGTYPAPGLATEVVGPANLTQAARDRFTPLPTMPGDQSKVLTVDTSGYAQWMSLTASQIPDGSIGRVKLATDVTRSLPPVPTGPDASKTVVVDPAGTGLIYASAPPATLTPGQVTTLYLGDAPNGVTRAKVGADCWLSPVPTGADVNKVLTVAAGPTLSWATPVQPPPAVSVGPDAPASPQPGQMWWRNDPDGNLYVYYNDGTSSQFVPAMSSVGKLSGPAGGDLLGTYPNPTINPTKLPWTVSGATLTPTDPTKTVAIPGPGGSGGSPLILGTRTIKLRAITDLSGADWSGFTLNNVAAPEDSAFSSWRLTLSAVNAGTTDTFMVARRAPGAAAGALTPMLTLDGAGLLTLPGSSTTGEVLRLGTRTIKQRLITPPGADAVYRTVNLNYTGSAWVQDDASKASWSVSLRSDFDNFLVYRVPAGSVTPAAMLTLTGVGDLTIAGGVATKATGTAWANPSDDRLKKDVQPYATGLAAILALEPITFRYNGRGGSQDDVPGMGFSGQATQATMPEMVSSQRKKLNEADEEETDILVMDTTALPLALVNAIKELTARVTALEAR